MRHFGFGSPFGRAVGDSLKKGILIGVVAVVVQYIKAYFSSCIRVRKSIAIMKNSLNSESRSLFDTRKTNCQSLKINHTN